MLKSENRVLLVIVVTASCLLMISALFYTLEYIDLLYFLTTIFLIIKYLMIKN
ncbi:MAG: hypothetical protein R3Y21_00470 [Mycoplasmatota bacterium]